MVIKECTVRLNRINFKELNLIGCSFGLGRMHFGLQKQSKIQISTNIDSKREGERSKFQNTAKAIRTQPVRIAKSLKRDQESNTVPCRVKKTSKHRSVVAKTKKNNFPIEVGPRGLVMAKQKYSVPWPSRIVTVRKGYVDVYFFGDGRTGAVKIEDLSTIAESKNIILKCLKRNITDYYKGIIEFERMSKVPDHLSITQLL